MLLMPVMEINIKNKLLAPLHSRAAIIGSST
jgi:hypothetical protein